MNGLNKMKILKNKIYLDDIIKALSNYDFSELNGKTILVTGATGLICSSLIDTLVVLKQNGIDMDIIAAGRDISKIIARFGNNATPFEYDALCYSDIPNSIDYIVHGASNASPELYTAKPVETMLSNIIGVNNLLKYCVGKQTKMVYISSSEMYGQKESEEAFAENFYGYIDQDNIRNSYSESKRASEMLCKSYAKEYGVNVSMIRPGHIYGPTASPNDRRVSSDFAYKAARGEKLEMLSSGLQKRSYCYCVDAACAILVSLLYGIPGEAYNIGTEDVTSIREMAVILADAGCVSLMAKEPTEEEKNSFNPMNYSFLSIEKIKSIGYKQVFPTSIGLEHTVRILKEVVGD